MNFRLILLLIISFSFVQAGRAQFYNLGQDPARVKWRQLDAGPFRFIYPEQSEFAIRQLLPSLNPISQNALNSLSPKAPRVPIVIHAFNTRSNGYTAWAPKRIELISCPPQDIYAQNWLQQLTLHEYRHAGQFGRSDQGFTRVFSWFTGEMGASLVTGLFVPPWFMEGDAVCTETALSEAGRGRDPYFEMPLRAQVRGTGLFSYDKAVFGSYRSFVPDHYVLGYSLVASVRQHYGYTAWLNALDRVAKQPYLITPFNRGLRQATGQSKEQLYRSVLTELDSLWWVQDQLTTKTPFEIVSPESTNNWTNYLCPKYLNDTVFVAYTTGMDRIPGFVTIAPGGKATRICTPGVLSADVFSVACKKESHPGFLLAWAETVSDRRWEQQNFSEVRIFDSETGQIRKLGRKTRYFAPALSPDGGTLVVVNVSPENECSLLLLNAPDGAVMDTLLKSRSEFYMTPSWSADGTELVFVSLSDSGKSLRVIRPGSDRVRTVSEPAFENISDPCFAGTFILWNGTRSGIGNIYALDTLTGNIYQVTSSAFGAKSAAMCPGNRKMLYSDYNQNGYRVAETRFEPGEWRRVGEIADHSASLYTYLAEEERTLRQTPLIPDSASASVAYRKVMHIFKVHSWTPVYLNYMDGEYGAGISFMSQNLLSTATTVAGYRFDLAEHTGKAVLDFSWDGWYPQFNVKSSYGQRAGYTSGDTVTRYTFTETVISGGVGIPFRFSEGRFYSGVLLNLHTSLTDISRSTSPESDHLEGTIHSLDYSLSAYRYERAAFRDLYPHWGQSLSLSFRHSPFGANNLGSIGSASLRLYFPGFSLHHGFRADVSGQFRNPGRYEYSNQIRLPRGYGRVGGDQIVCYAVNYKFPLLYPDLSLGSFAYLKRIKAAIFVDGGVSVQESANQKLLSTGIELTADTHFLRFIFPADIGLRSGFLPHERRFFTDFLFSVNLPN
jgi:hypothetical protein